MRTGVAVLLSVAVYALAHAGGFPPRVEAADVPELLGRVVAVGIPGAGAVSAVGGFHSGGPIADNPKFRAFTRAGEILDCERILVASSSNFGAPLARTEQPAGSILSIEPRGQEVLVVPPTFAAAGDQATALDRRVMLFTANSPAFLNRLHSPDAITATFPPVANPTAISINNAFGRPWFTSVPFGLEGPGIQSVIDPDGRPLAGAPSKVAGGVFSGALTNRTPQLIRGSMSAGALGTALLGKSPDGGGRAVFAGVHADGRLVQIHVEHGVDGLAPARTITPVATSARASRAGMVFNWVPNAILYVADPAGNSVAALTLVADDRAFRVASTRRLRVAALDVPVDIAPAVAEAASAGFSSNTTLAGGSDFYVANRGNGTIARLTQDGAVVAVRRVTVPGVGPLGRDRLNGVAVSQNADRLWVTVTGSLPGYPEGAVIELPAFGAAGSATRE